MASGAARQAARLYVGNISWTVSREQLSEYFSKFGRVRDARVMFNNATGMSRGYGFVQFQNEQSVQDVFAKDDHVLEGKQLIVKETTGQGRT